MPRNVPSRLAAHLAGPTTSIAYLLKVKPQPWSQSPIFGISTSTRDSVYDDGSGDGPITYYCASGYTALDLMTTPDLKVDNTEASGLLAALARQGMTADGIQRGDYDCARFVQYMVNVLDLTMGHVIMNAGQIGQVTNLSDQTASIELRSLTQILAQNSIIELTSITDRARYGGVRNKMVLRWYGSSVASLGAENDRDFVIGSIPGFTDPPGSASGTVTNLQFASGNGTMNSAQLIDTAGQYVAPGFTVSSLSIDGTVQSGSKYSISSTGLVTWAFYSSATPPALVPPAAGTIWTWDGTVPIYPDGYFVPGVVHWLTGANTGRENEIESYVAATGAVSLVIPTREPIVAGDTFNIRRDSDKSKTRAIADNNLPNFRGEPELPRADGVSLQTPTPSAG